MHLHEEYILRHKLDVPVVRYDKKANVFLRTQSFPYNWGILSTQWHEPQIHPGYFEINFSEPIHNSFHRSAYFSKVMSWSQVYWDDYEKILLGCVNACRETNLKVVPSQERVLVAWQMFLLIFDSWLAQHMKLEFFQFVEQSTRPDLDLEVRLIAYRAAHSILVQYSEVSDVLLYQILPLIKGHATWLEKLIDA